MNARRGRPPAYDRDTALRAIVETFRLRGFAATSLDDLAAATGMNRPSLFAAFGNKKAMYLTALESFRSAMAAAVGPALQRRGSLSGALTAYFDAAIGVYSTGDARGCLILCTAPTEAPTDHDIRTVLTELMAQIEAQLRDRIERALQEGEQIGHGNTVALSKILSAVLVAIAIQARSGIEEAELRDFAAMSMSLACGNAVP